MPPPRTLAEGLARRQDNFLLLRLMAAALVIYGHSFALTAESGEGDIFIALGWHSYSGAIAVDTFFLISGFMITGSYLRRNNVLDFVWARSLRLIPAYAACMFISAFLLGAFVTSLPLGDYFTDPATRGYALVNMTFGTDLHWNLPGVFTDNPRAATVNGALWTLPVEVRMYVWAGLLGLLGILSRRRYATFILLALILAGAMGSTHIPLLPISMFLRPSGMFALGALCFLYRTRVPVSLALTSGLALACWALQSTPIYSLAFALTLAAFVFWFAYRPRLFGYNRFGDYSYGLYLWGFPAQQTAVHLWPGMTPTQNVAISLPFALALGIVSWHAIEKPALALKRLPHALFERILATWSLRLAHLHSRWLKFCSISLWGQKPVA
jgi:peptidoglycan/LPS O-acetylase OafA/YrhL